MFLLRGSLKGLVGTLVQRCLHSRAEMPALSCSAKGGA
nr:MAG TPA: hypothetical protein [Caudoviricetes sp.]